MTQSCAISSQSEVHIALKSISLFYSFDKPVQLQRPNEAFKRERDSLFVIRANRSNKANCSACGIRTADQLYKQFEEILLTFKVVFMDFPLFRCMC